jgi:hypothetical protein
MDAVCLDRCLSIVVRVHAGGPSMRHVVIALTALASVLWQPAVGHCLDITTWGTVVPAGQTGVLQNDLDGTVLPGGFCAPGTGQPGQCMSNADCPVGTICYASKHAVTLGLGARLDLNGHSIFNNNGDGTHGAGFAIDCGARGKAVGGSTAVRCEVVGPGMIRGVQVALHYTGRQIVKLSNLTLHNDFFGLLGGFHGFHGHLIVDGVTFDHVYQPTVDIKTLEGQHVTYVNNSAPLRARFITLDDVNCTGNLGAAVSGIRVTLSNSTLSGNAAPDIVSHTMPVLTNTTCERSAHDRPLFPIVGWGVCAND